MPRIHIENIAVLLTTCSAQLALLKTGYYCDRQDNDIDWHSMGMARRAIYKTVIGLAL